MDAPCAICGWAINYEANGTYDPWGYHLDHIKPVAVAREQGWTTAMINALTNTRATHRGCNAKAGARLGQQRQRAVKVRTQSLPRKKIMGWTREW